VSAVVDVCYFGVVIWLRFSERAVGQFVYVPASWKTDQITENAAA